MGTGPAGAVFGAIGGCVQFGLLTGLGAMPLSGIDAGINYFQVLYGKP